MDKVKQQLLTYLKGMAMGGADVVPGVSGGTIAFITGIYGRLLDSISAFDFEAINMLYKLKFKAFWQKIDGAFLFPLLLGLITSLLTLAKVVKYFMENEPISLWSFFFGLIIISAVLVLREIKHWNILNMFTVMVGIAIAFAITIATPSETPNQWWFIFFAGSIAICAMILPGISGAFILLILGKYEFILEAINQKKLLILLIFGGGCLTGLLSFARLVSWLLNKYHDVTIAILSGFMIGSLNKAWPWKIATAFRINSEGKQIPTITNNVLPAEYLRLTNENPLVLQAIFFITLGIMLVVVIEKIAHRKNNV